MDAQMRYFGEVLLDNPGFGTRCMVDEPLEWVAFTDLDLLKQTNKKSSLTVFWAVLFDYMGLFLLMVEISHVTTSLQSGRCPWLTLPS